MTTAVQPAGSNPFQKDLIYDIGIHNGDDTAYYLSRGYRVIGVDANPTMIESAYSRFSEEVRSGRLTLLNRGILDRAGAISFFVNEADTKLSSFERKLAACHGDPCREIAIECVPLPVLFAAHGVPYYLKVDIEGADKLCAKSMLGSVALPPFASFEFMFDDSEAILQTLCDLGYRGFKLIYGGHSPSPSPFFKTNSACDCCGRCGARLGCSARFSITCRSGCDRLRMNSTPSVRVFPMPFRWDPPDRSPMRRRAPAFRRIYPH